MTDVLLASPLTQSALDSDGALEHDSGSDTEFLDDAIEMQEWEESGSEAMRTEHDVFDDLEIPTRSPPPADDDPDLIALMNDAPLLESAPSGSRTTDAESALEEELDTAASSPTTPNADENDFEPGTDFGPDVDVPHDFEIDSAPLEGSLAETAVDSDGDSLEAVVQRKHAAYLQEKREREAALALRRQRSRSAPACAMSLASPDTCAQRKRNEQRHTITEEPAARVEYQPRDSAVHVPPRHAPQNRFAEEDTAFDMAALDAVLRTAPASTSSEEIATDAALGCPWDDVNPPAPRVPRLEPLGKLRLNSAILLPDAQELLQTVKKKPKRAVPAQKPAPRRNPVSRAVPVPKWPKTSFRLQQRDLAQRYKPEPLRRAAHPASRKLPVAKREWNFDTTLRKEPPLKKRPMTAQEINRKVQSLIQRTNKHVRPRSAQMAPCRRQMSAARCRSAKGSHGSVYANSVLKSISEANQMAAHLGGRFRYRLEKQTLLSSDVSIDVYDCDFKKWLAKPFTLAKFLKRHQLLKSRFQAQPPQPTASRARVQAWLSTESSLC